MGPGGSRRGGGGARPPSPEPPAGMRGCRHRAPTPRALLCGLLATAAAAVAAAEGGRALPQLNDDIPFRVNWPGTEFSLVGTGGGGGGVSLLPSWAVITVTGWPRRRALGRL